MLGQFSLCVCTLYLHESLKGVQNFSKTFVTKFFPLFSSLVENNVIYSVGVSQTCRKWVAFNLVLTLESLREVAVNTRLAN